ncbi:MAG: MlaD family protein [Thermoleophilaceae bacterium]
MRRTLAIGGVLAAIAAGAVLTGAAGDQEGQRYRLVFDSAFGIVEGADFKVAGVRAGQVESFDLSEGYPPRAVIDVVVEQEGLRALRADARCEVKPQSLIGEYFVDCLPGQSERPLPDDTVPVAQTFNTITLDLVNNVLREPQRERLPLILNALGAGLAGRPADVQEVLKRAHPGLRETNQTLRILARQDDVIARFIADADTVIHELEERKDDVVRFVDESENAARVTATRREELARTFDRLPTFLEELEPTMARLEEVADEQVPVLRNLRSAAPDLNRTFQRLQPFAESAQPALTSLGELSSTGQEAIEESQDEVDELRQLAEQAPDLAEPLRKLLQALDDRDRSIEPDVRAAESAPPAPDKNADAQGKGFTGFESLLNYFYWQTLAINMFDEVSHILRASLNIDECSPYSVNPIEEGRAHCVSWLGPHQPGVTTPDPTEGFDEPTPSPTEARAERGEDERSAGAPADGGPVGGDGEPEPVDRSRPQTVLPDGVQDLVDRLGGLVGGGGSSGGGGAESAPRPQQAPNTSLLDFLLGP